MADGRSTGGSEMLSSYLSRWVSVAVLLLLISLAAAALYLEPGYPARVPLRIGVCAFDSVTAAPVLGSFAARVREQDGGDITWVWLGEDAPARGCDFYVMTSVQLARSREKGLSPVLFASPRTDGLPGRGVVVTREETEPDWESITLTSPLSATGFISPLAALADNGVALSGMRIEKAAGGIPGSGMEVAFGVILGTWSAGGIPLEQLRGLEEDGSIIPGALRVVFSGPPLWELVIVRDPATEDWKSRGFAGRIPRITAGLSDALRREMTRIGMASFTETGGEDPDPWGGVPAEIRDAAGDHSP